MICVLHCSVGTGVRELLWALADREHAGQVFSSFALSLSEVMLTKHHFESSLPAGRCSSCEEEGESFHRKLCRVDGYWKLCGN